ncbi:hypothetical protein G6F65_018606 [Rhizopus arrhizus]|nr:hypothetical protein G6F31_015930 [Rhizopus arrhizus]KAG1250764.1 hypothetical protein G6F65_018606 [Rhizopus arrhizus]
MDDGVRQRSTFELAQARQLDRTAGGQGEFGSIGQFQRDKAVLRGHHGAAFVQTLARPQRLAVHVGLAADVQHAGLGGAFGNHRQRDAQLQSNGQQLRRDDLVQCLQRRPIGLVARVLRRQVDQGVALADAIDEVLAQGPGRLAVGGGGQCTRNQGKQRKRAAAAHDVRFSRDAREGVYDGLAGLSSDAPVNSSR